MNAYFVEFDGINCPDHEVYLTNNYKELIGWVIEDLEKYNGDHADIYDEDGEFVETIEI